MKTDPGLLEGQLELVRPPAPGRLELVRAFLNTTNVAKGTDSLASRDEFGGWLVEHGLLAKRPKLVPTDAELEEARAVRSCLRDMAGRNNSIACPTCDAGTLAEASERASLSLVFDPDTRTSTLTPKATGVDGALGRILAAVHVAMLDRSWERLKQCADPTCAWAYYDHSKNGCSRWCSPDTCGNRSKVKAYRERKAQNPA